MKLFFVRHAESVYTKSKIYQPDDAVVSSEGIYATTLLAKRLAQNSISTIFSSDLTRAKQTSEILAKSLKKEVKHTNLLREWRYPSEIIGKPRKGKEIEAIKRLVKRHYEDSNWHYSDEENYNEFSRRVQKFITLLEKNSQNENILVVTHGKVIRMAVLMLTFASLVHPDFFRTVDNTFRLAYTGVTVCQTSKKGDWNLLMWNDCRHLKSLNAY